MTNKNSCHHCEGKGYISIRDCSGEIQREETCSFCGGLGYIQGYERSKEIDRVKSDDDTTRSVGC